MLEKRFYAVPPQLFTANGTVDGVITIAGNACNLFKVKQKVILTATGIPNITLEIKEIDSEENIQVGPIAGTLNVPGQNTGISARTDISAYTVALAAAIMADEQKRPSIDNIEIIRATYEEEPTVAVRSVQVDECGNLINAANPFPVIVSGSIISTDRITACDNDPLPGDIHSSVRISDCTTDLKINPDGSINVVIENPTPTPAGLNDVITVYNETALVASGVTTTIISYVTPIGLPQAIYRVLVSGENIARYDIAVNAVKIATVRTYYGGDLSRTVAFDGSDGSGYILNAGDTVTITVLHNKPYTALFEATLELVANPVLVAGETPIYIYNEITSTMPGTTYNVASWTVMPATTATLQRVLVSGENIARYDVWVNAGPIATQRTYYGGDLDKTFEFMGWNGGGVPLAAGATVTVKVLYYTPGPAIFEATIEAIQYA